MYKKTAVFGFLNCLLYAFIFCMTIYFAFDAFEFYSHFDSIPPFSAHFFGELPFEFIADKFGLNHFTGYLLYSSVLLLLIVPSLVCALKAAIGGLKQPNEFRKKRPAVISLIILNLILIAFTLLANIPLGASSVTVKVVYDFLGTYSLGGAVYKMEIGLGDIATVAVLILSPLFFIADLIKNKKDLLDKTTKQ
jgi:hypothetical protein